MLESSTRRVFFSRTMKHELHTSDRVTLVLVARTGPWSRPESTVLDSHGKHRDRRSQPAGSETEWRAFGERRRAPACRPPPGVQAQRALATRAAPAPARAASWMASGSHDRFAPRVPTHVTSPAHPAPLGPPHGPTRFSHAAYGSTFTSL